MAEAVVPEPSREQASQAGETLPRFERPAAVHGGRFMIGYAVIVVMVLAALLTIGFMSRGESSSTTAAGGLTTEERGFQRAREIATEVAASTAARMASSSWPSRPRPGRSPAFPSSTSRSATGATGSSPRATSPSSSPARRRSSASAASRASRTAHPGQPTPERLMLLRREAVELSFYTFKLLPEIQTVVSLLPPVPRGEGSRRRPSPCTSSAGTWRASSAASSREPSGEAAVRRRRPDSGRGRHDQPSHGDTALHLVVRAAAHARRDAQPLAAERLIRPAKRPFGDGAIACPLRRSLS